LWHEHGHEGSAPVVWLDVLDLPLVHYLEASYHIDGERQTVLPGRGESTYVRAGVVPAAGFERSCKPYPVRRYPWTDVRAALMSLASHEPDGESIQVTYVNPETGLDAENILGLHALMLRPAQTLQLPVRSPAMVFHLIEGDCEVKIGEAVFGLSEADTCCAPGYAEVTLRNRLARLPSFLFIADETPLHRKLGVFEKRDRS
jgi:gentisate 1,2-dioxygenase